MSVHRKTPAKVNLTLLVGPKEEGGRHELFTVFVPIDVYDHIEFSLEARSADGVPGRLRVGCSAAKGESNLAVRALRVLERHTGWSISGRIDIDKHIPVAAGLGGGSSDAAAALLAGMQALVEAGGPALTRTALVTMAREVGADVAFFLDPRPAIGRGIGEVLEPIDLPELSFVLLPSDRQLSTEKVYRALDAARPDPDRDTFERRTRQTESSWRAARTPAHVAGLMENDLEEGVRALMPQLFPDKVAIVEEGALAALVSGSGPTLFGLCAGESEAEVIAGGLTERGLAARPVRTPRSPLPDTSPRLSCG